ncbi:hypothetical protein ACW9HJ_32295 [Nocardia gipuzkoensis]
MCQRNSPTVCECFPAGHGRNNDGAHALSVGIAALNSTGLRSVRTDETAQVLRTEYRDDLIRTRTRASGRRASAKLARSIISGQAARRFIEVSAAAVG